MDVRTFMHGDTFTRCIVRSSCAACAVPRCCWCGFCYWCTRWRWRSGHFYACIHRGPRCMLWGICGSGIYTSPLTLSYPPASRDLYTRTSSPAFSLPAPINICTSGFGEIFLKTFSHPFRCRSVLLHISMCSRTFVPIYFGYIFSGTIVDYLSSFSIVSDAPAICKSYLCEILKLLEGKQNYVNLVCILLHLVFFRIHMGIKFMLYHKVFFNFWYFLLSYSERSDTVSRVSNC